MDAQGQPAAAPAADRVIVIDSMNASDVEAAVETAPPGATIVIGAPRLPVTAVGLAAAAGAGGPFAAGELAALLPNLRKIVAVQARERGRALAGRGAAPPARPRLRPAGMAAGRNEPCPCGSGKKRKKCHPR